jgi:hypothetical protein
MCKHVPCVNATETPGFVISSVQASMAGTEDYQYYSFTADATDKPSMITILYKPNWVRITDAGGERKSYNNWRVSMLRLQLQFDNPKVNVTPSHVNQWSTRQVFKVQLPSRGKPCTRLHRQQRLLSALLLWLLGLALFDLFGTSHPQRNTDDQCEKQRPSV